MWCVTPQFLDHLSFVFVGIDQFAPPFADMTTFLCGESLANEDECPGC
jgi:hypothetical protein